MLAQCFGGGRSEQPFVPLHCRRDIAALTHRQSERVAENFQLATAVTENDPCVIAPTLEFQKPVPWAPNVALTSETVPSCGFTPLAATLATCTLIPVATELCRLCLRRNVLGNLRCTLRRWLPWLSATSCFLPCSFGCFDSARWPAHPSKCYPAIVGM